MCLQSCRYRYSLFIHLELKIDICELVKRVKDPLSRKKRESDSLSFLKQGIGEKGTRGWRKRASKRMMWEGEGKVAER